MDHKRKIVTIVKMSCTWVDNSRAAKDQDKREKYPPLRLELKQQFKGYSIDQQQHHSRQARSVLYANTHVRT